MLSLNVPLILILMNKYGMTFGQVQDILRTVDDHTGPEEERNGGA